MIDNVIDDGEMFVKAVEALNDLPLKGECNRMADEGRGSER